MAVHTQTAQFKASPAELFAFLNNIENLPKWATGYAQSVRKEGEDYIVTTPMGDMIQIFESDEKTGTIDLKAGPTKEQLWTWPARITHDNLGGSVLAFTCVQMPDQPDADFEGQCKTLAEEFENIRAIVDAQYVNAA